MFKYIYLLNFPFINLWKQITFKNSHFVYEYKKETGEKATYRKDSSDYHTLRYIVWVHNKLAAIEKEFKACKELIEKINNLTTLDMDTTSDGYDIDYSMVDQKETLKSDLCGDYVETKILKELIEAGNEWDDLTTRPLW